jgi:hypothetical protein
VVGESRWEEEEINKQMWQKDSERKKNDGSSSYSMYLDGARRGEEPKPMKQREDSPSLVVAAALLPPAFPSFALSAAA